MKRLLIIALILCLTASTFGWQQKPILGRQIDWSHSLSDGLVGLWLMNEGSGNTVADLSGNGLLQTLSGPEWVASKYGPGVSYISGNSDYSAVAHSSLIDFEYTDAFTIVVFGKSNNNRIIVTKQHQAAGFYGYQLSTFTDGKIYFMLGLC